MRTASARRILWLLNHKTLIEFEPNLLVRLGFEVFIPKIIPPSNRFRSGFVTFDFDSTLTVPQHVLDVLNSTDFYESDWSPQVVRLMNRYFGTVFVMPYGVHLTEALRKFEGLIHLRAFGLEAMRTYTKALEDLYDNYILSEIEHARNRFWFSAGYCQLAKVEQPTLASREIYLPIGLPQSFWKHENTHEGSRKQILFVCPQISTNPFYSKQYELFKQAFGDLPHVIVGAQDEPSDDPNVRGFVTDDELVALYQESALLFYPSREPRHVHYSPIEASIVGTPVVFFDKSLLAELSPDVVKGRARNFHEARLTVLRLLSDDSEFICSLKQQQIRIREPFTEQYCYSTWEHQLQASGFLAELVRQESQRSSFREFKRTFFRPFLKGRSYRYKPPTLLPKRSFTSLRAHEVLADSLVAGIDFSEEQLPKFVLAHSGLSWPEHEGRWTSGREVLIHLDHTLPRFFDLEIVGISHPDFSDQSVSVSAGSKEHRLPFSSTELESKQLFFSNKPGSNIIRIRISKPVQLRSDQRQIALMLKSIRIVEKSRFEARATGRLFSLKHFFWSRIRKTIVRDVSYRLQDFQSLSPDEISRNSLCYGIDFRHRDLPGFVLAHSGLSWSEEDGRWTDGNNLEIVLAHSLPRTFVLHIEGFAYEGNVDRDFLVRIGNATKGVRFAGVANGLQRQTIEFTAPKYCNVIRIRIPNPIQPPNDDRQVGLKIQKMWIEPTTPKTSG